MQIINLRMHDVTHIDFRTMPDESGEDIYLNITIQSPNDSIDILVSADKHLQLSGKYNLETFLALNGIEVNRLHPIFKEECGYKIKSLVKQSEKIVALHKVPDESEYNNEYNITGNSWHYYAFEGLKSGSYSFTINAEDSEGNSNTKKISITIG